MTDSTQYIQQTHVEQAHDYTAHTHTFPPRCTNRYVTTGPDDVEEAQQVETIQLQSTLGVILL